MEKMNKLVSIIVPAYNVESTIIETLNSVVEQTYSTVEVIIVNDGSTDRTVDLVKEFIVNRANFSLYSKNNGGLPATRNYGFVRSKGEYVVFLDADDLIDKTYVEFCVKAFLHNDALSVVYTQTMLFERVNELFDLPSFSYERLLTQNCITATAMIKSVYFREIGMYDEGLNFCEDWDLWIRLLDKFPNVEYIEQPLFFYRRRNTENSMTDLNKKKNISEKAILYIYNKNYDIYAKYGLGIGKLFYGQEEVQKYKYKYYNVWYRKLFYLLKRRRNN